MKPKALPYNHAEPLVMHIDLNSCFAIIEQQANRLLRGRPVAVAAYDTPRGMVLAASYEAKRKGIKLGYSVRDAQLACPGIVVMMPDPPKYREAHKRFREVLLQYTSDIHPKSIDEFVLHLGGSPAIRAGKTMAEIGYEIKERIKESLGEAVTVNVGIGPNRFLAKLAAGLHKPDGLDSITHQNLEQVYEELTLLDLPGINVRYQARLNLAGISTPLDLLRADVDYLHKRVFKSIVGYYWYLRLRGWEIDAQETKQRSIGHQYALSHKTWDVDELERLLMKMCEKTGRRLRRGGLYAQGISLYLSFIDRTKWSHGEKVPVRLYSSADIHRAATRLLHQAVIRDKVRLMAVTVFNLQPYDPEQLSLLEDERQLSGGRRLSDAVDDINNRYGEFVITPAAMSDMQGTIIDRIAFGNVRDIYPDES